jgi:hypothetical protein
MIAIPFVLPWAALTTVFLTKRYFQKQTGDLLWCQTGRFKNILDECMEVMIDPLFLPLLQRGSGG